MIQRKQTVYLILAVLFACICMFMPLGTFVPKGMGVNSIMYASQIVHDGHSDFSVFPLFAVLLVSGVMSAVTIFLYKNRKRQSAVCVWGMIILLVWYALFAYFSLCGKISDVTFCPKFASILPLVSMISLYMARRGILYDERLVRAADRIR